MITEEKMCKFYKQNKLMATAERCGSMYFLNVRLITAYAANVSDMKSDLHEWHEKLAHQNIPYVKDVLKKHNVKMESEADATTCESCLKGKMSRLPYPVSNNVSSSTCEIIHADTCGPMEVPSIGGSRYFAIFKDDYSKYRKVCFVKNKTEIKSYMKRFIMESENETGNKVKIFRSDNGTEFVNNDLKEFFESKGIIHQFSVVYTPEQNGRAEREMRILVEAARTMLCARNLPTFLWAEAVNTAAYVINRTGKSSVVGKSPYELWLGKTYDISDLKVFGAPVYAHIPKQRRQKWDQKAEKGIMVGYGTTTKGYRIYIPEKNEVVLKRDVIFPVGLTTATTTQCGAAVSPLLLDESLNGDGQQNSGCDTHENTQQLDSNQSKQNDSQDVQAECSAGVNSELDCTGSSECSLYEPSDVSDSEDSGNNSEQCLRRYSSKRVRKQTEFYSCNLVLNNEPKTYSEAISSPDCCKWREAIQRELKTLKDNNTWDICEPPRDQQVVSSKWVFKIKNNNGNIQYKARLVARGFEQNDIINVNEIYAPVAKLATFRLFLAIATKLNLPVY